MTPIEYALLISGLVAFLGTTLIVTSETEKTGNTVFFYRVDTGACSGWASLIEGRMEHRVYDPRIEHLLHKGVIVAGCGGEPPRQAAKGSARILTPGTIEHFTAAIAEIRHLGYYAVVTSAAVDR